MALPTLKKDLRPAEMKALRVQAQAASELLKALSHETRLLIMCLLNEREMSVTEIEVAMDLAQATVSQQLARLRFDGLVETRREGRSIYYRIANKEAEAIVESLYGMFCKSVRPPNATK
ncbi:MAG: metalloregulator ArsR/SmtB family transcription factor [Granulosicoccaceae bacterium]